MANPPGPTLDEARASTDPSTAHLDDHNTIHALLNSFTISDATDVDIVTVSPTTGEGLIWDGSKFVPGGVGSTSAGGSHGALTGVTSDQHHAKSHAHDGADGSGTVAHDDLTGVGADDHHAQLHTIASHSDTTATGADLNTLVGAGNADALHTHTISGTQATTDLTDWSTGTPTDGALARYSTTSTSWVYISTTALASATALPTAITAGVTTGHVAHSIQLHKLFNAILGVST